MARFYGKIGYAETEETSPGVWTEKIIERYYFGDVTRNSRRMESSDGLNDNLVFNNTISILADECLYEHFSAIRYVEWMGARWKITTVEVQSPRLILTMGGVYNGGDPSEASENA